MPRPQHTAVAEQLMAWMRDCGFDDVSRDAVGNVVGIYNGTGTTSQSNSAC